MPIAVAITEPITLAVKPNGGVIGNSNNNYVTAHDSSSGNYSSIEPSSDKIGQTYNGDTHVFKRGFISFDTSGIVITPSSVNLWLYTHDIGVFFRIKKALDSIVDNVNFGAVDFLNNYSDTPTQSVSSAYKVFSLNASAMSDMSAYSLLEIAILSENDSSSVSATDMISDIAGIDFSVNKPYLEITY